MLRQYGYYKISPKYPHYRDRRQNRLILRRNTFRCLWCELKKLLAGLSHCTYANFVILRTRKIFLRISTGIINRPKINSKPLQAQEQLTMCWHQLLKTKPVN